MSESRRDDTGVFDAAYGRFADELYAAIRREAFGEDIGQTSWLTANEQRGFCSWLDLSSSSELLEVASGSGGPALFTVEETGCRVVGVDIHEEGVATANTAARERGLAERARFLVVDAREQLPFDDESFDAVICIDSINHLYDRAAVLADWRRVLRRDGRLLFTNAVTLTGLARREELIARSSSMGDFVFAPAGLDERLVREAGFADVRVEDVSVNAASIAGAWRDARERRREALDRIEGAEANASMQAMLHATSLLADERRVSRFAYVARRP
jgi:SAM-dependent methyltransferase